MGRPFFILKLLTTNLMMRTFFKTAISLFIFIFLMSSCAKNREPKTIKRTFDQEQFLTLKLKTPNAVTLRAGTSDDPMLRAENIRFVFYTGDSGSESVSKVVEQVYKPTMQEGFQIKLKANNYKLLVLANATEKLKELTSIASPLSNMTQAQALQGGDLLTTLFDETLGVAMISKQGLITIQKSMFHATKTIKTGLAVSEIEVEPMLARVLVFGNPEINGTKAQGLEPSFLINNLVKSVSPLRPVNKMSLPNPQNEYYPSSTLWTKWAETKPSNTDLIASYTADMMLNDENYWETIQPSIAEYKGKLSSPILYAKETTLPPKAYLKGLTPAVVIRYPYIPEGLTLSQGEGWLSYQGHYYTETKIKEVLDPSNSLSSPLKEALKQANITTNDFAQAFEKRGFSFYHKAYNYYVVYIRHLAEATNKMAVGRYGLVRANEYRIEIKSIQEAGKALPPVLSNNLEEIDELESLGVKLSVSPLKERSQDVSL